ncbi:hypothetical protein D3C87_1512610 [compost metagenome]
MLGQPRLQRALLLHVFLQFHQRRQAGFQARQILRVGLRGGLGAAALGIRFRHAAFQRGQFFLGLLQLVFARQAVARQLFQADGIRGVQLTQFLLQAFAALLQHLHLAIGVALGLGDQRQVLFNAGQGGAHLVAAGRGFAHTLFNRGQAGLGVFRGGACLFGAGGGGGQVVFSLSDLFSAMLALAGPFRDLLLKLVAT